MNCKFKCPAVSLFFPGKITYQHNTFHKHVLHEDDCKLATLKPRTLTWLHKLELGFFKITWRIIGSLSFSAGKAESYESCCRFILFCSNWKVVFLTSLQSLS